MAEVKDKLDYFGVPLTGIGELSGKYLGWPAIVLGSGVTLEDYDDTLYPNWVPRIAINESIRKVQQADFWCLSDKLIVRDYSQYPSSETRILAMSASVMTIDNACEDHKVFTVATHGKKKEYNNDFEFYSSGTTVGALELAWDMGFRTFFLFGNDYFRTTKKYYFDGHRAPKKLSERKCRSPNRIRDALLEGGRKIYKTRTLSRWAAKLDEWSNWRSDAKMYCVGSPYSQCSLKKISAKDACKMMALMAEPTNEQT